jgi:hypothetical protein
MKNNNSKVDIRKLSKNLAIRNLDLLFCPEDLKQGTIYRKEHEKEHARRMKIDIIFYTKQKNNLYLYSQFTKTTNKKYNKIKMKIKLDKMSYSQLKTLHKIILHSSKTKKNIINKRKKRKKTRKKSRKKSKIKNSKK